MVCQLRFESDHWWPTKLTGSGKGFDRRFAGAMLVAITPANLDFGLAHGHDSFPCMGLLESDGFAVGLADMGVVHELVGPRWRWFWASHRQSRRGDDWN